MLLKRKRLENPLEYQLEGLAKEWSRCTKCTIGCHAKNHVLGELLYVLNGKLVLPSILPVHNIDIMMIGEGPGVSEDVLGRPFIDESGQFLRNTISTAFDGRLNATIYLTNLVCCRPFAQRPAVGENRPPSPVEAENCLPRLQSTVKILKPNMILNLGRIHEDYSSPEKLQTAGHVVFRSLPHPSRMMRLGDKELSTKAYRGMFKSVAEEYNHEFR